MEMIVNKDLIFSWDSPVVMNDCANEWEMLTYNMDDWCNFFGDRSLLFRMGDKQFRKCPLWENQCSNISVTFKEFIEESEKKSNTFSNNAEKWMYCDYKYMKHMFKDDLSILKKVRWSDFGFPELSGIDSTIWLGNSGAHTPCHYDTYGCNLVVQLYGQKLWLLMPPDETDNLMPVRAPYEESSVYSLINFYTPSENVLDLKKVYKIVLKPGDALFVPRHWWHYVENLDVAISINTWIPLDVDAESHLEEYLVRQYILNTCKNLHQDDIQVLLNPNENELLSENLDNNMLSVLLERCKLHREATHRNINYKRVEKLPENCKYIPQCTAEEIREYVEEKRRHHKTVRGSNLTLQDYNTQLSVQKKLINSFCNPHVICLAKEKLLHLYHNDNS